MAYEKQTWKTGDVITAEKLNHIEEGIALAKVPSADDDVLFYDYDGTLVKSYSKDDFLALTAFPENPSHKGLTAQGWNWSFENAKSYVEKYGKLIVGQMYITDTGETRIYIHIDDNTPQNRLTFYVRFTSSVADNVDIDWGDGTVETKGDTTATNYPHEYATGGDYVIKLKVNTGTISFVGEGSSSTSGKSIYGDRAAIYSYNRGRITHVEIGNSVENIGDSAFFACYSLASITIPDSVTSIGTYAFDGCYSLTSIAIPDNVTSIEMYAFSGCYSLTSIAISDSVTNIGGSAFNNGCYSLTSITIPDSVTTIGGNVFNSCYSLASIIIPDSATSIGVSVFSGCRSLASITIPDGVTNIGTSMFDGCHSLTSIAIPDGVTNIGGTALSGCDSLTSITIPDSVTNIIANAFAGSCSVSEYHLLPTTPPTLAKSNAFSGIPNDCKIYVPYSADHSILNAYKTATNWSTYASYMVEEPQS